MENILTVENIDQSKYFYSAEKEEDKIIKVRIGYYFNRKNNTPDPENLFIKVVKVKFNSYKDNKIKFKLEDEKTIEYFKKLEKISIDEFKNSGILSRNKVKKYSAFLNKNTDGPVILTVNYGNNTKMFTKLKEDLSIDDLKEDDEVNAIIELESLVINKSDESNLSSSTNLVLKRLLSLKHIPVFTEKELPNFPFSDENNDSDSVSSSSSDSDKSINIAQTENNNSENSD